MAAQPTSQPVSRRYARPLVAVALSTVVALGLLIVLVGPGNVASVVSGFSRLAQNRAVQLAYFYKPPTDQTSAQALASSQAVIFLTQHDEKFRDQVRAAGYQGKILQYIMVNEVDGPAPPHIAPCNPSYAPWASTAADKVGDYCNLPEAAFLHNGKGERIYYSYDDSGPEDWRTGVHYFQIMNPANQQWRDLWVQRMSADAASLGYDGIFLDNLDVVPGRPRTHLENSDGVLAEYSTDAAYREALRSFMAYIRPRINKPMWANMVGTHDDGQDWDMFMPYLDGAMNESFGIDWVPGYLSPAQWEGQLQQADKLLGQGKAYLGVAQGHQDDTERMRFALSTFLLIDAPGANFRYSLGDLGSYRKVWDYPEFHVDMGEPLGPRFRDGATAWRRDFSCGHVRVDPADHSYEFAPDPGLPTCTGATMVATPTSAAAATSTAVPATATATPVPATPTPTASNTATAAPATPTPAPSSPTQAPAVATTSATSSQTIMTFDDLSAGAPLADQYPAGFTWQQGRWSVQGPIGQLTSNAAALVKGRSSGTLTLATPRPLVQVGVYVDGTRDVTITLSCSGQSSVKAKARAGKLTSINTRWTRPCGKITFASSANTGVTSFDNLLFG